MIRTYQLKKSRLVAFLLCSLVNLNQAKSQTQPTLIKRAQAVYDSLGEDTIVNTLEIGGISKLNEIISDAASPIIRAFGRKPYYYSHRIQTCTTNLVNLTGLPVLLANGFPIQHVGILIDGVEEFRDKGGGGLEVALKKKRLVTCHPSPVFVDKPESEVVKMISCIGRNFKDFNTTYHFWDYNCGGFVRDLLLSSGLDIPIFPNMGIGMWVPSPAYLASRNEIQRVKHKLFYRIAPDCNEAIRWLPR